MVKSAGIVAGLLVATAAGGAAYYYFQGKTVADKPEQLAAAVPENAYLVGYVATDTKIWGKLEKFGTLEARKLIGDSLQQIQKDVLAEEKLDYQKDIQPWLGNVMMAVLPTPGKESDPSLLVVSKVKDKLSALNFLNQMKAKSKTPVKEINYKGTKIFASGAGANASFTTSLNDWVMLAGDQQTIEKSIDTVNGAPSFSKKNGEQFFNSSKFNLQNPVASVYLDMQGIAQEIKKSGNAISVSSLKSFDKIKSMSGGFSIDDQGVRMKFLAQTTDNHQFPTAPGKVLTNFPADTLFLTSGSGIKQVWTELQKDAATDPELKTILEQMQQAFQQSTKLDLDKDIVSWMGGEYAVAVVPVSKGPLKELGIGFSAVVDSTDKDKTNQALQGLKVLASANGVATADRKSNGKDVTDLKTPLSADPVVSYGWLDNQSVFVSMGDLNVKDPLNKSKDFQSITGSLPQNNLGYLYVNFEQALLKLPQAQLSLIPAPSMALLSSIRGLGTAVVQDGSDVKMEGLLLLKSAQN